MNVDKEKIEYYHNNGSLPDWIYYQVNGKSMQENYIEQITKFTNECIERLNKQREREELEKEIEKQFSVAIDNILDDVLKELHF